MYETLLLISQAVKSGVPLSAAIHLTVSNQTARGHEALLRLAELLDKGIEPKVAAAQSGLPKPVVELLDAALTSDDFAATFDELAKLEISRSLTIHKIVQSLAYPILLFVASVLDLLYIFIHTVPGYEEIFNDFETDLPAITILCIEFSRLLRFPTMWLGFAAFFITLWLAVKILFPRFWFCIPVFGHIGRCLYSARILRRMASMVLRNVPLPDALEQCGKVMRNAAYRQDCHDAAAAARKGTSFAEIVLHYYWLFPAWLAPMLAADNLRESMSKSLRRAADTVEQQKDSSILFLQTLSLPMFIMFALSVVGWVVLALFMPLVKLISDLSS